MIFFKILLIIAIVIVALFALTFTVYIFNLDMKLMAAVEPMLQKMYDKRKKEPKI